MEVPSRLPAPFLSASLPNDGVDSSEPAGSSTCFIFYASVLRCGEARRPGAAPAAGVQHVILHNKDHHAAVCKQTLVEVFVRSVGFIHTSGCLTSKRNVHRLVHTAQDHVTRSTASETCLYSCCACEEADE